MNASPVDAIADAHFARWIELDPCAHPGLSPSETELTDFSPEGVDARCDELRRTLAEVRAAAVDDADRVTAALLAERTEAELRQYEAGDRLGELGAINGQVGAVRSVFDNMPTATSDDLDNIAARLDKVPWALERVRAGVAASITEGRPPALRQVAGTIDQCMQWAGSVGSGGWFTGLAALRSDLGPASVAAGEAMRQLGSWLRDEVAPVADPTDGSGEARFSRAAATMMGTVVDPREAYEWGWHELHRIESEIAGTIRELLPGASLVATKAHLDETTAVDGVDAWFRWLQDLTDRTIARMDGSYFDIDPAIIHCEAMRPPDGVAAAPYYTPPSEDLRIPGRTWYPTLGRERFPSWEMTSTVYHESVPGHHLQIGRVQVLGERLCRYRRHQFISGHGEGWALYAERLMDEIGAYADDAPGRLGFLTSQALRAARVVIDIGLHLGLRVPAGEPHEGESWTAQQAVTMLVERCACSLAFATSEVDRYLAWPAQAITYKLGEREWLAARSEAATAGGDGFDQREWHAAALDLGALGLAQLRTELRR